MLKTLSQRHLFGLSFLLIACFLSFGFYLEFVVGIAPCPLCILQRVTFIFLGVIFLIGFLFPFKKPGNLVLLIFSILFSLLGVFLAGRQVWLQHLPAANIDCEASLHYLMQVLTWDQVLAKILQGTAECTRIGWEFLGLSLATWTLFSFIAFLIASIIELFIVAKE